MLHEKCPNLNFFSDLFPALNQNADLLCKFPYSVQMWENMDREKASVSYY